MFNLLTYAVGISTVHSVYLLTAEFERMYNELEGA
jgi:hypothetical protein